MFYMYYPIHGYNNINMDTQKNNTLYFILLSSSNRKYESLTIV